MNIIHFPHELTIGGVQMYVMYLLKGLKRRGHNLLCATLQDGPMRNKLEELGIPVVLMDKDTDLNKVALSFNADVLHGHTCCGGSFAIIAANNLKSRGKKVIGGETLHSICGEGEPFGDFEIVQVTAHHRYRPKSTLIHYTMDDERLQVTEDRKSFRARYGIPEDAFVIGRNGRLVGTKLPHVFIDVLANIPFIYGMMCGGGELRQALEDYAIQRGCINRLAFVEEDFNIGNRLNAMDLFVYPTHDEAVCVALVEAMLFGLPVVTYSRDGLHDIIKDRITGMFAYSAETMTERVKELIRNDVLRNTIARAGKEFLISGGYLDIDNMAYEHERVYQTCLNI